MRVCECEDEKVGLDLAMSGIHCLRGGRPVNGYEGDIGVGKEKHQQL